MSYQSSPTSLWKSHLFFFLAILYGTVLLHHPETGWNVNTRLNLVFAVVDRGTLSIDAYHDVPPFATEDKALFEGRHYSDKIFGVSLLALPAYWLGQELSGERLDFQGAHFLMKSFAVSIPAAISVLLFHMILMRTGVPPRKSLLLAGIGFLGTMWFGYSTVFYPYIPGVACCLGALYITLFPRARRLTPWNCVAVGCLLGYAMLCDLIFGLAVFGVGVVWLLRLADQTGVAGFRAFAEMTGARDLLRHAPVYGVAFWIGVLAPLSLFVVYCYTIFGEFSVPYQYEVNVRFREGMSQGFMGATAPRLHALYFITIHPFRGIFFWSPVLLFALWGCVAATREAGKRRILGWLGLATFVAYLVFTSGYYMWWGGWAMGPRFMIPALPFVLFGLGEFARNLTSFSPHSFFRITPRLYLPTIVAGALSVALTLPVSLYDPQIPQNNQDHVLENATVYTPLNVLQFHALRAFYTGRLQLFPTGRFRGIIESDSIDANVLGYLLVPGVMIALLFAAAWFLPDRIGSASRVDFPFRTIDGSAAPPPSLPR